MYTEFEVTSDWDVLDQLCYSVVIGSQFSETYLGLSKEYYNKIVIDVQSFVRNIAQLITWNCTPLALYNTNEITDKTNDIKNENLNRRKPRMQFII